MFNCSELGGEEEMVTEASASLVPKGNGMWVQTVEFAAVEAGPNAEAEVRGNDEALICEVGC